MRVYSVSGFTGLYPVPTAAVVVARDREDCKRVLLPLLARRGLSSQVADWWTIEPICDAADGTPAGAYIASDGNY